MNTTKKMTHKDYFTALLDMPEVQNYPGMTEFIEGRITALEKKASAPKKDLPAEISNQRLTSLVTQMVRENEVERVVEKRVSYFTIAVAD